MKEVQKFPIGTIKNAKNLTEKVQKILTKNPRTSRGKIEVEPLCNGKNLATINSKLGVVL